MIKKTFLILFLLGFSFLANAQEKINIAFIPATYTIGNLEQQEANIIAETVINAFVKSKKFTVVDRRNIEALEKEKQLQRTEAFLDSKNTIVDGVSKGASYLIENKIVSVNHTGKKNKWNSTIEINLKILNISTGEIVTTSNITSELQFIPTQLKALKINNLLNATEEQNSTKESFSKALESLSFNVENFAKESFPTNIQLVEWVEKDLKTKVGENGPFKYLVIAAGSDYGMTKGDKIDVITSTEVNVNGKSITRNSKIATATIERVDDENFSVAKITEGEKDLKKAITNYENISLISK
ncbi:CsgG/HfaB family protein [Faecalibacter macacae]|uniref:Penicillin-binding protein activator LpoB n=1 Tax=Faecalibacter macacae TaxID=1859289 RepID=A0A3L9M8R9_9FLAO|nr:CsgG/HfaB family protein [Faecalibacter macacae]RLZ08336.1 hypothetical protein EAH69_10415 [Faecalibacter macacae]